MAETPDVNALADVLDDNDDSMALMRQSRESVAVGSVGGATDTREISLPWLKMVHGVGKLAANFNPGDLVLGDEYLLAKKGAPVEIIVISMFKYWKEYLSNEQFMAGMRPRRYLSKKEVEANGGTTEWVNHPVKKGPDFSAARDLKILIKKPKDLICGLFGMEFNGDMYAPAFLSFDGAAEQRVARNLDMAETFSLAQKPHKLLHGVFSFNTFSENGPKGPVIRPKISLTGYNSDEFIAFVLQFFQRAPSAPAGNDGAET